MRNPAGWQVSGQQLPAVLDKQSDTGHLHKCFSFVNWKVTGAYSKASVSVGVRLCPVVVVLGPQHPQESACAVLTALRRLLCGWTCTLCVTPFLGACFVALHRLSGLPMRFQVYNNRASKIHTTGAQGWPRRRGCLLYLVPLGISAHPGSPQHTRVPGTLLLPLRVTTGPPGPPEQHLGQRVVQAGLVHGEGTRATRANPALPRGHGSSPAVISCSYAGLCACMWAQTCSLQSSGEERGSAVSWLLPGRDGRYRHTPPAAAEEAADI